MNKIRTIICLFIILISPYSNAIASTIKDIDDIKKAIVTLDVRVPVSAYDNTGRWQGTGFVVDEKQGLIVTNSHVSGIASVGTYFVTFYNGQQLEAKLIYYDTFADVAVLKLNKEEIPNDITRIKFANQSPQVGDDVVIVGNNEGQGFSMHHGYISDLHAINGSMPQASYILNMNSAGGSSGSPVLNAQNQAVGIIYGAGKTHALACHSFYIKYALEAIKIGQVPKRQHIGVITKLYSLDNAIRHQGFPSEISANYIKKYPDARNRVIVVKNTLIGSNASHKLLAGDIIWEAGGKEISSDLSIFDDILNQAQDSVRLGIYRNGAKLEIDVPVYDLNKNKISKMLDLAGGLFFAADEVISYKSGVPIGAITLSNVQPGSTFSTIQESFSSNYKSLYRLVIKQLGEYKINSLQDMIDISNKIITKKHLYVDYINYQPYWPEFNDNGDRFISSHEELRQDISFDSINTHPRLLEFNTEQNEWIASEL
jgi:S1-C subfamily serine protease